MIMMHNKYHYIDLKLYYFHNKPNRRSKDSMSNFVQLARILQREGLIGWLLKFAKPKNWHAMILLPKLANLSHSASQIHGKIFT